MADGDATPRAKTPYERDLETWQEWGLPPVMYDRRLAARHFYGGPKEQLLPPSYEPIWPENPDHLQDLWVDPPILPRPGETHWWIARAHGYNRVNEDFVNQEEFYEGLNWESLAESAVAPKFRSNRRPPKRVMDLSTGGMLPSISERFLNVFREFDDSALTYIEQDVRHKDDEYSSGKQYFLKIKREIQAIDFANSCVHYLTPREYNPSYSSICAARITKNIISNVHVFTDSPSQDRIFISEPLKNALEKLKPAPFMVEFHDPGHPTRTF